MTDKALLLSLKPIYAELVFKGLKVAELRRRIPCMENRDVFIYVSSPARQLRGGFRVGHVWKGSPEEVWNEVSDLAGVDKQEFDAYYTGSSIAYALRIEDVWEHDEPIDLDVLRDRFPRFVAPQSWRYVRSEEYAYLKTMRRRAEAARGRAADHSTRGRRTDRNYQRVGRLRRREGDVA